MKTVTCEIPLTGLPADVSKRVVGCEIREPKQGEWFRDSSEGKWAQVVFSMRSERPTLILRPEPWEGFKVLTGAAAVTRDAEGCCYAWSELPRKEYGEWDCGGIAMHLTRFAPLLGITLPPSTGDWRRDIWLNPDHPANRGEGK